MVNFGPLSAEIGPVVWGTPANFNGFGVLAALLHSILVVGISQTLRRWTEGAIYIRQGGHHVGHWPTFLVIIITQPKSWYSFYRPTEGGRPSWPRHCNNRVAINLEYSGISLKMEKLMKFTGNSVHPQRKLTLCYGCSLCQAIHMQRSVSVEKNVDLSNMGRQAFVSHMSSSWCGMTLDIWSSLFLYFLLQ